MQQNKPEKMGQNCVIGENASIGSHVILGHNCIIEDGVIIGDNSYIDSGAILRRGVVLGADSFVGAHCILGEYQMDFCRDRVRVNHPLTIGRKALIRSNSVLYSGSVIGEGFQTGHHVTVREKTEIGNEVSIGTLSDVQGNCHIGNYVRLHSNVHIGQLSRIDDFVWIFPYVVLTNDPTPPSENFVGVHVYSFAIIATGTVVMPGLEIGQDSLVGAGAVVTKNVPPYAVVVGNPGKVTSDVRRIKNKVTGESVYPWREHFKAYMPWSESDFASWYADLDLQEKQHYGLQNLQIEDAEK